MFSRPLGVHQRAPSSFSAFERSPKCTRPAKTWQPKLGIAAASKSCSPWAMYICIYVKKNVISWYNMPIFIWRIFVPRLENGINLFITETHGGQGAAEMLEEFGIPFLPVANDNQKLGPHWLPPMTSLEQKHGTNAFKVDGQWMHPSGSFWNGWRLWRHFVAVEPSEQWKWKVIGRMAKVLGRVQTFKNQWLSFSCILARLGEWS